MSHGITSTDSGFAVRKPTWHGLFPVLEKSPKSVQDALKKSGLHWTVQQRELFIPTSKTAKALVEGYKANVRSDTGDVLGVVTDDYEVVQNHQAFEFLSSLIGSDAMWECAGSVRGGRRLFVLCRIPEYLTIGGDEVRQYMLVYTSHDGSLAMTVKPTDVRTVCENTLRMAMGDGLDAFKIRHVGDPTGQLHAARNALRLTIDYGKQFAKFGNKLASQKMTERHMRSVIEELWPAGESDRSVKSAERTREAVMDLFLRGKTVGNAAGSKWSAWSAITEYDQHYRKVRGGDGQQRGERRFIRAMDDPDGVSRKSLVMIAG